MKKSEKKIETFTKMQIEKIVRQDSIKTHTD